MPEKPAERLKILRIVDANLNRSGEALRVVEDCARFLLDHAGLANSAKGMRHRLHRAVGSLGVETSALLGARDTESDVGTELLGPDERKRTDVGVLLRANFQRLEQSLRVLEEYAKLLGTDGGPFEALRYDGYTLEKQFASPPPRSASLDDRKLLVLVGTSQTPGGTPAEVVEMTRRVLEGGCRFLEFREKQMPDGACLELACELRELTREAEALLIVNDRVDVARAASADGVHLGLDDLPIEEARRILGPSKLVGLTAHSLEELAEAEARGADYIGVGTMFPSLTKPELEVKGAAELIPAAAKCAVPCYAIGGITRANVDVLRRLASPHGAHVPVLQGLRVAIGSAITSSRHPAVETRWFVKRLAT